MSSLVHFKLTGDRDRILHMKNGFGPYICLLCQNPASGVEHEKPECNKCSDWIEGCRGDCTLSRLTCDRCGIEERVS